MVAMFYHAALLFDSKGFRDEATALAEAADKGDLVPLHSRASEIAARTSPDAFLLRKYGEPLKQPLPLSEVYSSPYRNPAIGEWFMIIMSTYMTPCPYSLGYNWRILVEGLEVLGWAQPDIGELRDGLPVGLLLGRQTTRRASGITEIGDPYWEWIRPDYAHNQGGWLPLDECVRLRDLLLGIEARLLSLSPREDRELSEEQCEAWRKSLGQAYREAMAVLESAIESSTDLYFVTLWDWDDGEDDS